MHAFQGNAYHRVFSDFVRTSARTAGEVSADSTPAPVFEISRSDTATGLTQQRNDDADDLLVLESLR